MAITDHSKSAGYAHGMSAEKLQKQLEEIDQINSKYPSIKILKGIL